MAWLNFSVMTIWSAMTPAGGMLPTWRRDDDKFVCGARAPVRHIIALEIMRMSALAAAGVVRKFTTRQSRCSHMKSRKPWCC
jgi:hypothetical protein